MKFKKKLPLIILIAGRARSGKSSLADFLKIEYESLDKKVIFSPYTKYLKLYIEEITNTKIDDNNKPRDLLQQISSKVIKGELSKNNFFIDRQVDDIEIYSFFADIIIIPDVRFPKEIEIIKQKFDNVVSIGIKRKNYISTLTKQQQEDITETALDNYNKYDFEVINDVNTNLQEVAKKLVQNKIEVENE